MGVSLLEANDVKDGGEAHTKDWDIEEQQPSMRERSCAGLAAQIRMDGPLAAVEAYPRICGIHDERATGRLRAKSQCRAG
jgi:hypothetical protein